MKTTAIRLATVLASVTMLGGMVAAPFSAFAYYGAIPYQSAASSACNGAYDPNCFIEETNYLNNSSIQYESYAGNAGYSYLNDYGNQNSYNNTNSYYGNSWNTPSNNYSYGTPSYGSYSNSYANPYSNSYSNTNGYNAYNTNNYGYSSYPSYSNNNYGYNSYNRYNATPAYSYQYSYQYHY